MRAVKIPGIVLVMALSGCYRSGGHEQDGWDTEQDLVEPERDGALEEPDILPESPVCGNEIVEAGEICDDGDMDDCTGTCNADCSGPSNTCGDGVAACGEECDDGEGNSNTTPHACRTDCTADPCGPGFCLNDPPDGLLYAEACFDGADCEYGADCRLEQEEVFNGEVYVSWPGGQCLYWGGGYEGCDPDIPAHCPAGSTCLWIGDSATSGMSYFGCFDSCASASSEGVPWESNCDCRESYSCQPDPGSTVLVVQGVWSPMGMLLRTYIVPFFYSLGRLVGGVCKPGCSNDRECCEIWHDNNDSKTRDADEVTLLPPAECTDTCNRCTYACERNGCPDGECRIGDPCAHPAQCPPYGICLDEYLDGVPSGVCTKVQCDLIGRECPAEAGCAGMGGTAIDVKGCVVPCDPGSGPGDPSFTCRDVGAAGIADAGDAACFPVNAGFWLDGTVGGGFCWPGNFPGGSVPIGGNCDGDADCASPLGIGACINYSVIYYPDLEMEMPFCVVHCDVSLAQGGICGSPDTGGIATGACVGGEILNGLRRHDYRKASSTLRTTSGLCLESCENPGALPEASFTGCTQDGMACIPVGFLDPDVHVGDGSAMPAGLCFPACTDDVWCAEVWPDRGTCNTESGVCEP